MTSQDKYEKELLKLDFPEELISSLELAGISLNIAKVMT